MLSKADAGSLGFCFCFCLLLLLFCWFFFFFFFFFGGGGGGYFQTVHEKHLVRYWQPALKLILISQLSKA